MGSLRAHLGCERPQGTHKRRQLTCGEALCGATQPPTAGSGPAWRGRRAGRSTALPKDAASLTTCRTRTITSASISTRAASSTMDFGSLGMFHSFFFKGGEGACFSRFCGYRHVTGICHQVPERRLLRFHAHGGDARGAEDGAVGEGHVGLGGGRQGVGRAVRANAERDAVDRHALARRFELEPWRCGDVRHAARPVPSIASSGTLHSQ